MRKLVRQQETCYATAMSCDGHVLGEMQLIAMGYLLQPPESEFQAGYLSCLLDFLTEFGAADQVNEWVRKLNESCSLDGMVITEIQIVPS